MHNLSLSPYGTPLITGANYTNKVSTIRVHVDYWSTLYIAKPIVVPVTTHNRKSITTPAIVIIVHYDLCQHEYQSTKLHPSTFDAISADENNIKHDV